jgi:hypothetical protein
VSEGTYHRCRAQYGGMKAADVKRLKELKTENARLSGSWPTRTSRSWRSRGVERTDNSQPLADGRMWRCHSAIVGW